jgi:ribosomal protein L11 methyltransferase
MPWVTLTIEGDGQEPERLAELLSENGAQAVSFEDAADQAVLEPRPGETRLWSRTRVSGLFAADIDRDAVIASLRRALGEPVPAIIVTELPDQAWERVWLERFQPMRFGRRLWVCPHGHPPPDPDAVTVLLDPGLAFGTGTHATTALCLEWLDGHDIREQHLVDYGCGSGILAVAALKLGARHVWAVDHDPQALIATAANAAANGVADRLTVTDPAALTGTACDGVVANILAEPLLTLAPRIAARVRPGGAVVLSGIMPEQAADVMAKYQTWFNMEPAATREEWVRLSGRRKAVP